MGYLPFGSFRKELNCFFFSKTLIAIMLWVIMRYNALFLRKHLAQVLNGVTGS